MNNPTQKAYSWLTRNGHGHVCQRDDGAVAKCGGPGHCSVCKVEQVLQDLITHVELADALSDAWPSCLPVLPPQTEVTLCGGVVATIATISIGSAKEVEYECVYWIGGERKSVWVYAFEVTEIDQKHRTEIGFIKE